MKTDDVQKLLDETFKDVALVTGGIFVVHNVDDKVVWQVMKHLDLAHDNARAKLTGFEGLQRAEQQRQDYAPHPAVEALMMKLNRLDTPQSDIG